MKNFGSTDEMAINVTTVAVEKHMTIQGSPPGAVSDMADVNDDVLYRTKESTVDSELEFTLHKLLTQDCDTGGDHDPLGFAIEKAIAEMEFPELLGDTNLDASTPQIDTKMAKGQEHLTVERILAENSLQPANQSNRKRPFVASDDQELTRNKRISRAYDTLSPESLSPFSDSESQFKHKTITSSSKANTITSRISSHEVKETPLVVEPKQGVVSAMSLPPKLTNEYTMSQVAEMKKRIINTHKLMLNFNFLKDGYSRSCTELKRALVRLKQSEYHRAQLLIENEKLKKLALNLSQKLDESE